MYFSIQSNEKNILIFMDAKKIFHPILTFTYEKSSRKIRLDTFKTFI